MLYLSPRKKEGRMFYTYNGPTTKAPRRKWSRPKARIAGDVYMKVRDRQLIKELRQERGLTQRQLATLAKCTQATISAIETGKLKNISEDLGAHIAHWLERRPRELFEKFDEERVDALIMKNEARRNRQRGATSAA